MNKNDDKIIKTYVRKPVEIDEENFTVLAIVSDETVDRYDEIIKISAWKKGLDNYKKHPVLLSSHDYSSLSSQIGYAEDIFIDDEKKALIAKFKYFVGQGNNEADWGFFLAKQGLAAYSVGFRPKPKGIIETDNETDKKARRTFVDVELLEISQVVVPANPSALQKSIGDKDSEDVKEYKKMLIEALFKEAIPYHKYPLAPKDTPWDASSEVAKATVEDLKKMCAVIVGDPENKTSYKLPHHLVNGYKTVWRAVVNAAARLNQTQMPKEDLSKVKEHLAKHYKDFDEIAPWEKDKALWDKYEADSKSLTDDELIKLFGTLDYIKDENTNNFDDLEVISVGVDEDDEFYEDEDNMDDNSILADKLDMIINKLDVVIEKLNALIEADFDYDKLGKAIASSIKENAEIKTESINENALKKIIDDIGEIQVILNKYDTQLSSV